MILPPEKLRLGDLLHQRIPFKVPKYQRTFAWEQPEIEDFAKDLRALYRARSEGRQHLHFFGGLVSVERDAPGTISGRIFEVVDGQQRLTSFILTISLLVDSFLELKQEAEASGNLEVARNSEQYANDTRDSYLYYHELITNERFLRMMLSAADNDFFVDLIEKRDPRPVRQSHHRLVDALDCLRGDLISHVVQPEPSLPALEVAEKFTRLQQLRMSILEDCYVILIKSDNRNEAYRLFAVLNDRGKTLSDGDLLRSHTLEILEGFEAHQERVEKCWDEILDHKGDEINSFLRTYYPSHQGERAPSRDLADSYRESFFPFDPPVSLTPSQATDIVQRVRNLDDESQTYFDLVAGRWPYPEPGVSQWDRDRLKRLILVLKHTLCLPLLLSAARLLPENMFAELVHLMERFSFRYITIVGAHPTRLANCYYSNAKAIRENPRDYSILTFKTELSEMQQNHAQDIVFEPLLSQKLNYATSSMRPIIRYFLTTLEDYQPWVAGGSRGKPKPDKMRVFDLEQTTIEHIYPANADSANQDATLEPLKNTLGNLSFWAPGDNSGAGNRPFLEKVPLYENSSVSLNRQLANLSRWTVSELETRANELIQLAKKIYSLSDD